MRTMMQDLKVEMNNKLHFLEQITNQGILPYHQSNTILGQNSTHGQQIQGNINQQKQNPTQIWGQVPQREQAY